MQAGIMLQDLDVNALTHIQSFLNPRPAESVHLLPESYPVLTNAQVNYNIVMARCLHANSQSPCNFTTLASAMHEQDIMSGRALFFAIEQHLSERTIIELVERFPDALTFSNKNDMTPLCEAIKQKCTYNVWLYMVEKNRDILLIQCNDNTPLVHRLHATCDYATLDLLIDSDKLVLAHRNSSGMLPLSIALRYNRDLDVIKLLVDKDNTDLIDLSKLPKNEKYKPNLIPLHIAIFQTLSLEIIMFLVNINPSMLTWTDAHDRTALHLAVCSMQNANANYTPVVEFLAKQRPDAKTKKDENNEIPIHIALEYINTTQKWSKCNFIPRFVQILQVLIDKDEKVLTMKDRTGRTPLRMCMNFHMFLPQYFRVLVGTRSMAVLRTQDTNKNTPLQQFLNETWAEWKELANGHDQDRCLDVLAQDSTVLTMHNDFKQFPLHLATRVTTQAAIFMKLINNNVEILKARDEFKNSALDMFLGRKHLIYPTMQQIAPFIYPQMKFDLQGHEGNTLLHTALIHGVDPEVMEWLLVLAIALKHHAPLRVIQCLLHFDIGLLIAPCRIKHKKNLSKQYYRYPELPWHKIAPSMCHLPIQTAAEFGASLHIMQCIYEAYDAEDMLLCVDEFLCTPLHIAILHQKTAELEQDELQSKRETNKDSDSDSYVVPSPRAKNGSSTLKYMVNAGELALLIQDHKGNTPLHMALDIGSNKKIVQMLINACSPTEIYGKRTMLQKMPIEQVFGIKNKAGYTPLHFAIAKNHPPSVILFLMRKYPPAMLMQIIGGYTPMHSLLAKAIHLHPLLPLVESLLCISAEVLLKTDNDNRTPVRIALELLLCQRRKCQESTCLRLIELLAGANTLASLCRTKQMKLMRIRDCNADLPLEFYRKHFIIKSTWPYVYDLPSVGALLESLWI